MYYCITVMLDRHAKKHKSRDSWEKFIKARNKFNSDIKKAKNDYMIELLGRNAQTPNKFWTSIKGILPAKSHNTASK